MSGGYNTSDTIAAIAGGMDAGARRHIIRISGPRATEAVSQLVGGGFVMRGRGLQNCRIRIDEGLGVDGIIYYFPAPRSYTGDDLIEVHVLSAQCAAEAVLERLLAMGIRQARGGEFTFRAYVNGKLDLAQAEAVAQIVCSGSSVQLAAAQRLLAGGLNKKLDAIRSELLDIASLIAAGLDFSGEDIEFISTQGAATKLDSIIDSLNSLLKNNVGLEEMLSLPGVAVAGVSNAGKSSLVNALLGVDRSIVSSELNTTRDVLASILELEHTKCMLLDTAGIGDKPEGVEELAQASAMTSIRNAQLVLFCVDMGKDDWEEDAALFKKVGREAVVLIGTKRDLVTEMSPRMIQLERVFKNPTDDLKTTYKPPMVIAGSEHQGRKWNSTPALPCRACKDSTAVPAVAVSTKTGAGLGELKTLIDGRLGSEKTGSSDAVTINQRHKLWITQAISLLGQARDELRSDNEEVAAMLLHGAYRTFGELWNESIDDAMLERIFSQFCIGK
jgi:tRNA modification GTPase